MGRFRLSVASSYLYSRLRRQVGADNGASPQIISRLKDMTVRGQPNSNLTGKVVIHLHPEEYEKFSLIETVHADLWKKIETEIKDSSDGHKYFELGSNLMVIISLVESGAVGIGLLNHFREGSRILEHLSNKIFRKYDSLIGVRLLTIESKLKICLSKTARSSISGAAGDAASGPGDAASGD